MPRTPPQALTSIPASTGNVVANSRAVAIKIGFMESSRAELTKRRWDAPYCERETIACAFDQLFDLDGPA